MKLLKNKSILCPMFFLGLLSTFSVAKADYNAVMSYSCPSGGELSGTTCTVSGSAYAAKTVYTYNGDAIRSSAQAAGVPVVSTFPSGVEVVGTTGGSPGCEEFPRGWSGPYFFQGGVTVAQYKIPSATNWVHICGDLKYSCPSGGTLSGNMCDMNYTYPASSTYSCPSGGIISGTKCMTDVTVKGRCGNAINFTYSQTNQPPVGDLCLPVFYRGFPLTNTRYANLNWNASQNVWNWTCLSDLGFSDASCQSIPKLVISPQNGQCGYYSTGTPMGSDNYTGASFCGSLGTTSCDYLYPTMRTLCEVGTNWIDPYYRRFSIVDGKVDSWNCDGISGGASVQCKPFPVCGLAQSFTTFAEIPTGAIAVPPYLYRYNFLMYLSLNDVKNPAYSNPLLCQRGKMSNLNVDAVSRNLTWTCEGSSIISCTGIYIDNVIVSKVANPEFSPEAGTYSSAQDVFITTSTPGADIYYTTDGITNPTVFSKKYITGLPIKVLSTQTIKAIAVKSGLTDSDVAVATYIINYGSGTCTPDYQNYKCELSPFNTCDASVCSKTANPVCSAVDKNNCSGASLPTVTDCEDNVIPCPPSLTCPACSSSVKPEKWKEVAP